MQPNATLADLPETQAGRYSTKINVHNNTGITVTFRQKAIRLRGGEVAIQPSEKKTTEQLRGDWATEVVCRDIYTLIGIQVVPYSVKRNAHRLN